MPKRLIFQISGKSGTIKRVVEVLSSSVVLSETLSAIDVAIPRQMIPSLLADCVTGFRVNRQLHEVREPVHVIEVCQ